MIEFFRLDPRISIEDLGFIPMFFSEQSDLPAAKQLDMNYQHGGGWRPMDKWTQGPGGTICYPGEAPLKPVAEAYLNDEIIRVYESSWVAISSPATGKFEVSRID